LTDGVLFKAVCVVVWMYSILNISIIYLMLLHAKVKKFV